MFCSSSRPCFHGVVLTTVLLCCLGNPLHSTALEEDLKSSEEGQTNKGKENIPQTLKTSGKQRGAAMKRRETERNKENEKEETEKKRRTSSGGKVKTR